MSRAQPRWKLGAMRATLDAAGIALQIDDSQLAPALVDWAEVDVRAELDRAKEKHRGFPSDPIHGVAIVQEESGEAMRAAIQAMYEGGDPAAIEKELIQTAAMCLRMLAAYRARDLFASPGEEGSDAEA